MRQERPGNTLQPTALIHEAYLQLVAQDLPDFQNRAHFYGVAARIVRQILISNARRRCAQKRGSGKRTDMPGDLAIPMAQSEELLAVDEALRQLASQDARKAAVVELKHFGATDRTRAGQRSVLERGSRVGWQARLRGCGRSVLGIPRRWRLLRPSSRRELRPAPA